MALSQGDRKPLVSVGLVTDIHYADADTRGTRHYRESLNKMREAVRVLNRMRVDVAVELGDLIDATVTPNVAAERGFVRTITAEFGKLRADRHFVLGNHCVYSLRKDEFLDLCEQRKSFYSFDRGGVHFVILDACYRRDGVAYQPGRFAWPDTDIPPMEREWLEADLSATNLPTLVFVHQRLDLWPGHVFAIHSCQTVRRILEDSCKVLAVFQGHSHKNRLMTIGGIPYITLGAMVEGSGSANNGYSAVRVYSDNTLTLTGFRRHAEHPGARPGCPLPLKPVAQCGHLRFV
jgi:predicted phosphodiesterase